jgi:leader peptidase (prepilin peptidase)/N-methyltransferase
MTRLKSGPGRVITPSVVAFTLFASLAAAASWIAAPGTQGLFGAALAIITTAIAAVDLRRFVIPDLLVLLGLLLALIYAATFGEEPATAVVLAFLRGALIACLFLLLRAGYARMRGREGIGLGDIKLAGMAGVWLDVDLIPFAIAVAAFAALAVVGVRHWILGQPMRTTSRVPFGFFFAPAIWLAWFAGVVLFAA